MALYISQFYFSLFFSWCLQSSNHQCVGKQMNKIKKRKRNWYIFITIDLQSLSFKREGLEIHCSFMSYAFLHLIDLLFDFATVHISPKWNKKFHWSLNFEGCHVVVIVLLYVAKRSLNLSNVSPLHHSLGSHLNSSWCGTTASYLATNDVILLATLDSCIWKNAFIHVENQNLNKAKQDSPIEFPPNPVERTLDFDLPKLLPLRFRKPHIKWFLIPNLPFLRHPHLFITQTFRNMKEKISRLDHFRTVNVILDWRLL